MYDFESILEKEHIDNSTNTKWEQKHRPLSVGVGTNVPFNRDLESKCFVDFDLNTLLKSMLEFMDTIQKQAKNLEMKKFKREFEILDELIEEMKKYSLSDESHSSSLFEKRLNTENCFRRLLTRLNESNEMQTIYNEFSDDSEGEVEEDDIIHGVDG